MKPETIAKYTALAAEIIESGVTLEAFCADRGINPLTLRRSLTRLRKAGSSIPALNADRADELLERYIEACKTAHTVTEVAQALGVSRSVASKYLSRRGLKPQRIARRSLTHNLSRCRAARAKVTPSDFVGFVTSVYVADVTQRPIRLVEIARRGMGLPLLMTPAQADTLREALC